MQLALQRLLLSSLIISAAFAALAVEPAQDVDSQRHGNLAAAQNLVREAFDKVSEAQAANRSHLGGHAERAKQLMLQANEEIKLAATSANGGIAPTKPVLAAPAGVVYVPPTNAMPGPGYQWAWHSGYGWGWHHPVWGWHRGWT